ncbi:hypothetical protein ABIB40_002810 [Pedobacter sp. UYP30]|uniref:hypothetical protein n=1 Tax=Pedobacter sp. UYP30 TaxID=1756400 RepID=UPI00339AD56F
MTLTCVTAQIDWLSLGTLVATLVTALATFWTVLEVKKQRETSYRPEIYLGNQQINFYGLKWKDTFLPFSYSTEEIKEFNDMSCENYINIDLHNVGFGVAKAIEYEWSFDIQRVIESIDQVNHIGFFHVHYDKILEISAPQIEFKFSHMVTNQLRKNTVNYILSSSIEKIATKINVPSCYIDLYLIFLSSALNYYSKKSETKKEVKTHNIELENFPQLKLKLAYKDLHGKSHSKSFGLRFSFNHLSSPENATETRREYGQQLLVATEITE